MDPEFCQAEGGGARGGLSPKNWFKIKYYLDTYRDAIYKYSNKYIFRNSRSLSRLKQFLLENPQKVWGAILPPPPRSDRFKPMQTDVKFPEKMITKKMSKLDL